MIDTKPWFESRTIWATLVSMAASIGALFGFQVEEITQANLTDAILHLIAALAGLVAIFGRLAARETID